MMACPYVAPEKTPGNAEVAGLMSFGPWNQSEMNAMTESLRSMDPVAADWNSVTSKVRTRSPEECVTQIAMMPYSYYNLELPAAQLKNGEAQATIVPELSSGPKVLEEMALSENETLRKVVRAIRAVGNDNARRILAGNAPDLPSSALEAAGILAVEKISRNLERVRVVHKQHILKCLGKIVTVLKESVRMKKGLIDEARFEGKDDAIPSESELSSDEKAWQSGPDENAFAEYGE
jgi:hypothetical protein